MKNFRQDAPIPDPRLLVYGDESGLDERAAYFLMGGLLGAPLDWQKTRSEWRKVLRRFGVRSFHSNDFFGSRGQYRDWAESRRDSFLDSLLNVLSGNRVTPLGCAIHIGDYRGLTNNERRILSGAHSKTRLTLRRTDTNQPSVTRIERNIEGPDAQSQVYRTGFNYFLGAVVFKSPAGRSIDVVLDRHETFATGASDYFRKRREGCSYPEGQTLWGLDFVASADEPAIQAADLYVHIAARKLNGYHLGARRQRAWKALCTENEPFIMDFLSFKQQLDPIEQWDRQFNIDWGFPPEHESAFLG